MAPGDLVASTPVQVNADGIKAAVDALTLAAVTDKVAVVPLPNVAGKFLIFKVERAA